MVLRHGPSIRERFRRRLMQGPATMDELCEIAWGEPWDWPEACRKNVAVHLSVLRREMRTAGGREIVMKSSWEITEGH